MFTDERFFFIIHHSSFIIHHSSFIIHHSSFIIHHSSFIIHRSNSLPLGQRGARVGAPRAHGTTRVGVGCARGLRGCAVGGHVRFGRGRARLNGHAVQLLP